MITGRIPARRCQLCAISDISYLQHQQICNKCLQELAHESVSLSARLHAQGHTLACSEQKPQSGRCTCHSSGKGTLS